MDGWWLQTANSFTVVRRGRAGGARLLRRAYRRYLGEGSETPGGKRSIRADSGPYVGDPLHPLTVFRLHGPPTNGTGPAAFLKDYRGYLQADAFNGYDGIYLESEAGSLKLVVGRTRAGSYHEHRQLDPPRMETALAWMASSTRLRRICASGGKTEWRCLGSA